MLTIDVWWTYYLANVILNELVEEVNVFIVLTNGTQQFGYDLDTFSLPRW